MSIDWSILVCCHNSQVRVPSTLRAISRQSIAANQTIEVIVIDNDSSDSTSQVVKAFSFPPGFKVSVVSDPRPGLSFARQTAIQHANGHYLCFLDDDNDAAPNYLEEAEAIFESHPDVCFCGGESSWPASTASADLPLLARFFAKSVAVGAQRDAPAVKLDIGEFLWGAGLCIRASDAKALYAAGFHPLLTGRLGRRILSGEDGELTLLLQLNGGRGYYSNRLQLVHRVDPDRLNLRYYSKLFTGMGMALPILLAYRRALQLTNRQTPFLATQSSPSSTSRARRFACLSRLEITAVVALYAWLGACFARGALSTKLSRLPAAASLQAKAIARALATSSAQERR